MDISDIAVLFDSCSTYEQQYLPTFRKVLSNLNSTNVIDIATMYDSYKNAEWFGPASKKHVKSLMDKLIKAGKIPPRTVVVQVPQIVSISEDEKPDTDESTDEEEDTTDNDDLAKQIKYLGMKAHVLQEYFNATIPYIHLLPPEVLADLIKKNIWGRISRSDDI